MQMVVSAFILAFCLPEVLGCSAVAPQLWHPSHAVGSAGGCAALHTSCSLLPQAAQTAQLSPVRDGALVFAPCVWFGGTVQKAIALKCR